MKINKYYLWAAILAFLVAPLAASIGLIGVALIFPPIVMLALVWGVFVRTTVLPESAAKIFAPIMVAFCYYMAVWITIFGLSNYHFDHSLFLDTYFALTLPYLVTNFLFAFTGDYYFFPLIQIGVTIVSILIIIITCSLTKKKIIFDRKITVYVLLFVVLSGIAAFQHHDRNAKVLAQDYQVEQIQDEVDFYDYRPFHEGNRLKELNEPASITFQENYPRIDGATAAYPVYGAIAQALYQGLDENTVEQYVNCTKTSEAYERLIDGQIDIFFGAQPSAQQLQAAKEKGIELTLVPIAKEAFVFFVHQENPVDRLTLEQIQDIYQKKITSWSKVGGNDEKIMPFQRPENSGSQTIMLAKVMGDKQLPPPLWEEYAADMGGIISQVAAYRNYSSSIGYSFRYFTTGMKPNENIQLLTINDVEPTVENIRNGTYPFTVDVYAVTAGSANPNTTILIDWMLSEQGQKFIEKCGYVQR